MIEAEKVKSFWKTRGDKVGKMAFESIANLEEKPELLQLKISLEQKRIMPLLALTPQTKVLDLGAGVGQWTFRFAPYVKEVLAVEYMDSLCQIGRLEAKKRGIDNVNFITNAAEMFQTDEQFDLVFISGLFVYLNIEQAQLLMNNILRFVKIGGMILVRDGVSILEKPHHINNRYSSILNEYYSAFYRTRDDYITLFKDAGFRLIQDGQMFDEGCPLNKFTETRLWYFQFASGIS